MENVFVEPRWYENGAPNNIVSFARPLNPADNSYYLDQVIWIDPSIDIIRSLPAPNSNGHVDGQ